MLNIYLARHGQNEDNVEGILNGHRDRALTELGIAQAKQLAEHIKASPLRHSSSEASGLSFSRVYASPLQRAYKTAEIITDALGLEKPVILEDLIERDFGVMTGQRQADIEKLCAPNIIYAEKIIYFLSPAGAETFPDLMKRGQKVLDEIRKRHKEGNILLVTHGDIGKMIYATYYNLDWQEVLTLFHFGNSDLLILSVDSAAQDSHVFKNEQFNF